jgi:hypothetical protein
MKQIFQKLKYWYRGEYIPYTLQEMMDLQRPIHPDDKEWDLPDKFEPPLIARILNPIGHFWLRHWKWIIGTIIGLGILIVAILEYCRKVP